MNPRPYELEVISDQRIGTDGFLFLRRIRLRNRHPDGTRSREWLCDFIERSRGPDAVAVVLWRPRSDGSVEVLLRQGLRPALHFGRDPERLPIPDRRDYFFLTEIVAGIIEPGERGEPAIRQRAVDEAWEEAGYRIGVDQFEWLGPPIFPSPGMTSERLWLMSARAPDGEPEPPPGDGSPMEEGAQVRWVALDEAVAMCRRGELEDMKTEIALRRLEEQFR